MQKADSFLLKYNAAIIIVAAMMNNLSIGQLVDLGYSSSSVLIYRSLITFFITLVLSAGSGTRILPRNFRLQGLFMLNSGISLLLLFQSYVYLAASTVAMVQRLDIPFAIFIGFISGKRKKDFKLWLSVLAFCMVLSIFFFARHIDEKPAGLLLAIIAIMMTSYSYMLIKRSTAEENNFVIVNTVNIGCILVGVASGLFAGNLSMIRMADLWVFLIASVSQFLLNYSMAVLYKHHEIERGRRPYLISALVVLVAEQLWKGKLFDIRQTGIIVLVITVIYLVTLDRMPWTKGKSLKSSNPEPEIEDVIEPV